MLGTHQWLPENTISCIDHSQGTPSSHHAAAKSQLSNAGLDADMAGSAAAVLQSPSPRQDSSIAALSIHGAEAASVPNAFGDCADITQAGCAEQRSAASDIIRAGANSHKTPDRPVQNMSEVSANGDARSSTAA